jgi:tetratricopeptide (TPR) repeat protein
MRNVGEKLLGMDQPLGALRFFDLSLKVHQETEVSLLRSKALVALGRIGEAEQELNRFLQAEPQNGQAYFLFGRIYLSRNDYQAAERYFRWAQALFPEGDSQRSVASAYLGFNQLFLDRDALYARDLSPGDYVREIENLTHQVVEFKAQVLASSHEEVRGMEPHLETMVKLFQHWRAEIIARNPEVFSSPSRV